MNPVFTAWFVALAMAFAATFVAARPPSAAGPTAAPALSAAQRRESPSIAPERWPQPSHSRARRVFLRVAEGLCPALPGVDRVQFQRPPPSFPSSSLA